jgi:hypothetical protein
MNTFDYTRSFIQFTTANPSNIPRTSVDAVCTLTGSDGVARQFVLSNACIGENMYADKGLVQRPGTEFLQVASNNDLFMFIKDAGGACPDIRSHQRAGDIMPSHSGKGVELVRVAVDMKHHAQGTPLTTHADACEAMLDNRVINVRTTYSDPDGTKVVMDFPLRCTNVWPEEKRWQIDTGRILAFAPASGSGELVERLRPAYIVANDWDWAEIAIQSLSFDGSRAARYDDIHRIDAKIELCVVV